jgi:hypothetical protein
MAKREPRGRIPQLYRDMRIGDRVVVHYGHRHAFHLLRSVWVTHYRQEMIADGYDVPWLYLEPVGKNRTLVVRMRDESEVKASRAAFLAKGKKWAST